MSWLRRNMVPLVWVVVFALLVAAGVWLLRLAMAEEAKARAQLESSAKQREQLVAPKPRPPDWISPSPKNRLILETNAEVLKEVTNRLYNELSRGCQKYSEIDGALFHRQASSKVQQLLAAAKSEGILLPPTFGFGFYYYYSGAVALRPNTVRLQQQLDIVETVVNILIKSKVLSIDEVLLVEPPGEDVVKSRMELSPAPANEILPASTPVLHKQEAGRRYELVPFQFAFRCDTKTLREVLNELARNSKLFIVAWVQVSTERPAPASRPAAAASGADGEPKHYIYGEEKIRVQLLLYWVNFINTRG